MQQLDVLTLDGWQLDYFTGLALGHDMLISNDGAGPAYLAHRTTSAFSPSVLNDSDLMPVLQKMRVIMKSAWQGEWLARADGCNAYATGTSLAQAVCRALVLGRWGSTVELVGSVDLCEDLF